MYFVHAPKVHRFFVSWPIATIVLCATLLLLQGCAIKPDPIDQAEHEARVAQDQLSLYAGQEPIEGPLSMEDAIARALKYNYDHRLALMESAFHNQQLTAASLAMLPKLAANAGYTHRANDAASSSISYETRKETLEPSLSSERDKRTADLTLTWTVLDFGLSYFQASQQADRLLIMQERKRRVVNNIVKEVIGAYWKALTADKAAVGVLAEIGFERGPILDVGARARFLQIQRGGRTERADDHVGADATISGHVATGISELHIGGIIADRHTDLGSRGFGQGTSLSDRGGEDQYEWNRKAHAIRRWRAAACRRAAGCGQ